MTARPTRRVLLAGAAAAITSRATAGDATVRRIIVVAGARTRLTPNLVAFEDELRRLGHIDGGNTAIDYVLRSGELSTSALTEAIAARISDRADAIIAIGPERALAAAAAATRTVPIVMVAIDYDPLTKGYITSLARPGGNITGVFLQQIELTAKRLELLKEAVPDMRRVALLWDRVSTDQYEAAGKTAEVIGVPIISLNLREAPYDYEHVLAESGIGPGDGMMVMSAPDFFVDREQLAAQVLRRRIPSIFTSREWVDAGGLMSYGSSSTGMCRLAARYVDKILKGVKPADLPVEQPTRFELVINLKTAKALGLTIPPMILARADEVIE
jgi:putative tryptophan/tyrosine transport system substrate-binding protein